MIELAEGSELDDIERELHAQLIGAEPLAADIWKLRLETERGEIEFLMTDARMQAILHGEQMRPEELS